MSRASFRTLTLALVASCCGATIVACSSEVAPSPDSTSEARAERASASSTADAQAKAAAPSDAPKVASTPEPSEPKVASPEPAEPILASAAPSLPPSKSEAPPKSAEAPVDGASADSDIRLDTIEVGKGWGSSRCEDLGSEFEVGVDSRVNVCFRVVHSRVDETVTVEWARDGRVRQAIDVHIKPTRAYRTRAWLPVSAGRAGDWTATVKSEDGSVLGQVEFRIAD